jgi:hypothetical protein
MSLDTDFSASAHRPSELGISSDSGPRVRLVLGG